MFRTTKSPTRADSTETRLLMKENLSDTDIGEYLFGKVKCTVGVNYYDPPFTTVPFKPLIRGEKMEDFIVFLSSKVLNYVVFFQ